MDNHLTIWLNGAPVLDVGGTGDFAIWLEGAPIIQQTAQPASEISGSTSITFGQTGSLTDAGLIAGNATLVFGQSGNLVGAGALAGTASLTFGQSGTLAGDGAIAGTTTLTFGASATISVSSEISGTVNLTFSAWATASLSGMTTLVFGVTGRLSGGGINGWKCRKVNAGQSRLTTVEFTAPDVYNRRAGSIIPQVRQVRF